MKRLQHTDRTEELMDTEGINPATRAGATRNGAIKELIQKHKDEWDQIYRKHAQKHGMVPREERQAQALDKKLQVLVATMKARGIKIKIPRS